MFVRTFGEQSVIRSHIGLICTCMKTGGRFRGGGGKTVLCYTEVATQWLKEEMRICDGRVKWHRLDGKLVQKTGPTCRTPQPSVRVTEIKQSRNEIRKKQKIKNQRVQNGREGRDQTEVTASTCWINGSAVWRLWFYFPLWSGLKLTRRRKWNKVGKAVGSTCCFFSEAESELSFRDHFR